MSSEVRWVQRFRNFKRAMLQLQAAVELYRERELSNLEKQGMIQAFEFTHELAWKTLKDFFENRGNNKIFGSRDATREAFAHGLIYEGGIWMEMIQSRNLTSHTYNEQIANDIVAKVSASYLARFEELTLKLTPFIASAQSTEFGLPNGVILSIQNILRTQPKVEKAVLYGSRAKGNFHNGSDIDLVLFGSDLSLDDLISLKAKLDDLDLVYIIDIENFNRISNEDLKEHIERVGKLFYRHS